MGKKINRREFIQTGLAGAAVFSAGIFGLSAFSNCKQENSITNENQSPLTFFVDSESGNDDNDGLAPEKAFKSLGRLKNLKLSPGDSIKFKRGSRFNQPLFIYDSGNPDDYIVLTDYGDVELPAPSFTNPVFEPASKNFGNCIRLKGSYIIVENLYFHHTVAELPEDAGRFLVMWELGAIYIDKGAEHCIVRNNELFDCGVGIKSYGPYATIKNNYIHDCNRILKKWGWGPLGIWLGADHQEVCYNKIFNYKAIDPRINWGPGSYGGGADGGAIEIDDARFEKTDISIHHNYSRDNQGFIEVTWTDVLQNPRYENFRIHHNVSDDYQQFVAIWQGAGFKIDNNTIIRRKRNVNDWGVFNITQYNSRNFIRNNIIVVENEIEIFLLGRDGNAQPNSIIENNLYFAASGNLNLGLEAPGEGSVFEDPKFLNYQGGSQAADFSLSGFSPAIDQGLSLGYPEDFDGKTIPMGVLPDIGAFEYSG